MIDGSPILRDTRDEGIPLISRLSANKRLAVKLSVSELDSAGTEEVGKV